MRVIFELHHPKHYHQFKNLFHSFDDCLLVIKQKDVLEALLQNESLNYVVLGETKFGLKAKLVNSFSILKQFINIIKKFKPDLIVSKASPYSTVLSKIYPFKTLITPDSEIVTLTNQLVSRLSDKIITQHCFEKDFGKKHVKLDTFFESCYLHPNYYFANSHQLTEAGYDVTRPYIAIRFIAWGANHDLGIEGLSDSDKIKLVQRLQKIATVVILSESTLPEELESLAFKGPANHVHHLLYFASLYLGDSQSMATEAALLGTPAIRCNEFVGLNDMSNFKFLENEVEMLFNFPSIVDAVLKAEKILADSTSKSRWQFKRKKYFESVQDPNVQLLSEIQKLHVDDQ